MAVPSELVNLSHEQLEFLCSEQEAAIETLREQLRALRDERDRALSGLTLLTEALRRRGCCDHDATGASL